MPGKHGSSDVLVLVGGYNATGVTTTVTNGHEGVFEDTTPFGVTDSQSGYVGLRRGTFSQSGFYDDTPGSLNDELLNTLNGTDQVTVVCFAGQSVGVPFVGYAGTLTAKIDRQPGMGKFTRMVGTFQVDGIVEDLSPANTILWPFQTTTATLGPGASVNNAAGTAAGGTGYLEISALTLDGATSFLPKIQHSVDNSAWFDLIVFGAQTTAPFAERIALPDGTTVNQYVRVQFSYSGTPTTQSVSFFVGFVRN